VVFSDWVGLPFRERGLGPEYYDCWGLFVRAFEAGTGLKLDGAERYGELLAGHTDPSYRGAAIALAWRGLEAPTVLKTFDAAVMTIRGRWHVGLMVDATRMLHIPADKTSVIEPVHRFRHVMTEFMRHEALL
jgi:hypothetical protein